MGKWRDAFALSASQVSEAEPPGTAKILAQRPRDELSGDALVVNHDGEIIKFPAPSADPRDPLNFPQWHKMAALFVVSVYAFVGNFTSSVIAPGFQIWNFTFPHDPRSVSQLTYLSAVHVLFLGAGNIWWVPLSNWLGRRPVLIVATLIMTLCSVWCALSPNYDSLLAARIFQGIGGAASDTVAPALVGDLFFIHQRGKAMALYTILLCVGPLVGGIAGGYIAFRHGWAYLFWVSTALSAFCFVGALVFVPETLFVRYTVPESSSRISSTAKGAEETQMEQQPSAMTYKPYSFAATLGFGKTHGRLLQHVMKPWRTLALPGTWVVMLHYAGLVGGIVTITTVGPQILAMPPYLWKENVGLINLGGIIGAALGYAYTFVLSDWLLKRRAKSARNGMAEAEDRLPSLFFPLGVATSGLLVFGFCAQYPGPDRWVGLGAAFAMVAFGLMQIPSVGFNYLIDSYGALAADAFTMVTILRAIISFAWTFFAVEWVQSRGAAEPFGIFGMLMGLFSLTTVPLWVYGKRMRIATASKVERWN